MKKILASYESRILHRRKIKIIDNLVYLIVSIRQNIVRKIALYEL